MFSVWLITFHVSGFLIQSWMSWYCNYLHWPFSLTVHCQTVSFTVLFQVAWSYSRMQNGLPFVLGQLMMHTSWRILCWCVVGFWVFWFNLLGFRLMIVFNWFHTWIPWFFCCFGGWFGWDRHRVHCFWWWQVIVTFIGEFARVEIGNTTSFRHWFMCA